eukprot:7077009-Pyramimonas_sp.AAC.1
MVAEEVQEALGKVRGEGMNIETEQKKKKEGQEEEGSEVDESGSSWSPSAGSGTKRRGTRWCS